MSVPFPLKKKYKVVSSTKWTSSEEEDSDATFLAKKFPISDAAAASRREDDDEEEDDEEEEDEEGDGDTLGSEDSSSEDEDEEEEKAPPPAKLHKSERITKPAAPKQGGNAKSKNYCFTLNNYSAGEIEFLKNEVVCKYLVAGKEVGENGTPHLQGQVVFANQRAFSGAKAALGPRFHIEVTKDLQASILYCKKDGDFFEVGVMPKDQVAKGKAGKESSEALWKKIREGAETNDYSAIPDKIRVTQCRNLDYVHSRFLKTKVLADTFEEMEWYFGGTGTGKSRTARTDYPGAYIKMLNKWWDGYEHHDVVIIEDIDPTSASHLAHFIKTWTDHYPFPAEIKGNTISIRPRKFIITSNYRIEEIFPDRRDYEAIMRRFNVWEFTMEHGKVCIQTRAQAVELMNAGLAANFNPAQLEQ